ncbi:MAG: phosphotransferase family protein [Tuberibacillus sp.]
MDIILKTLTKKYGNIERLTGGFTNTAYKIQTNPPLVAKMATLSNEDLINEMNTLKFLEGRVAAPKYIDHLSDSNALILITTFEQGRNGQSILDTDELELAHALFHRMGLVLAQNIHTHPYTNANTWLRTGQSSWHNQSDLGFIPKEVADKLHGYLNKVDIDPTKWVLTHGDYGSHNILIDHNRHLTVIDWEWSEWFHPLADIAWSCWNTRLHYPNIADGLNQTFIKAYQSIRSIPVTEEKIKIYALYKLWNILLRVKSADPDTQQKWIARLKWTFETEILPLDHSLDSTNSN